MHSEILSQLKEAERRLEDVSVELVAAKDEALNAKNQIYVPARGCKTDAALAEYLTKYPEREQLKILFLRESEGIYQFGQRKVYIKVMQRDNRGPHILVRVGGGFMHID